MKCGQISIQLKCKDTHRVIKTGIRIARLRERLAAVTEERDWLRTKCGEPVKFTDEVLARFAEAGLEPGVPVKPKHHENCCCSACRCPKCAEKLATWTTSEDGLYVSKVVHCGCVYPGGPPSESGGLKGRIDKQKRDLGLNPDGSRGIMFRPRDFPGLAVKLDARESAKTHHDSCICEPCVEAKARALAAINALRKVGKEYSVYPLHPVSWTALVRHGYACSACGVLGIFAGNPCILRRCTGGGEGQPWRYFADLSTTTDASPHPTTTNS